MATAINTVVYAEDWAEKLQEELDEPIFWKDICNVEISNTRVLHNPYFTDPAVQTNQRGTAYTYSTFTETDESVTISTSKIVPVFIDRADLAQSTYTKQMELAKRQGVLLNEAIETAIYANHANMTNFGSGDITGGSVADTTQITVSSTNIDDIIRHIKRVIRVAAGDTLLQRNGGFVVWRPADFELLEGFMMANGFVVADQALRDGARQGVNYMGLTHYASNLLSANHVVAGVKKLIHIGILKDTYGQIVVDEKDPASTSGIAVVSRVDFETKVWAKTKPVIFDVNVA
jgi:hypothetical protein